MKKYLVALLVGFLVGCSPAREVVQIYKGDPAICTTTQAYSSGEGPSVVIGATLACNDGSTSLILNGTKGDTGSGCSVYRPHHADYVNITCGNDTKKLYDGNDGKDGDDGVGCKIQQLTGKVKITCGSSGSYAYLYDGKNGEPGASCAVSPAPGGANVKCGTAPSVFLANGSQGTPGNPGRDGLNGKDGEDAVHPMLSCNVHNLANWDGITNILTTLSASAPVGNFNLANFNVGDSQSANGFPGMPANLQSQVGTEGYALDCYGYLNVETSGMYTFKMLSDDGVRLVIQDQVVINDPGLHAPTQDTSTSRELQRGPNKINVIYYQGPATQIALQLKWSGPNLAEQVIPAARFTH